MTPVSRRQCDHIIKDHFDGGLSYSDLAKKYGRSRSSIAGIINRARLKDDKLPPASPSAQNATRISDEKRDDIVAYYMQHRSIDAAAFEFGVSYAFVADLTRRLREATP